MRELQVATDVAGLAPVSITADAEETYTPSTFVSNEGFIPYSSITFVRWKGDTNSWLDVYSNDFQDPGALGLGGLGGSLERLRYTNDSSSPLFTAFAINPADARETVRIHDRGECSSSIPYRSFFTPLVAALDDELCTQIENSSIDCSTRGRAWITPVLHDPDLTGIGAAVNVDEIEIHRSYDLSCEGVLDVAMNGRFVAAGDELRFVLGSARHSAAVRVSMDFKKDVCAGVNLTGGWLSALLISAFAAGAHPAIIPIIHGTCGLFDAGCVEEQIAGTVLASLSQRIGLEVTTQIMNTLAVVPPTTTIPCTRSSTEYDADGTLVVDTSDFFCLDQITTALIGVPGAGQVMDELTVSNTRCLEQPPGSDMFSCTVVPDVKRVFQAADGWHMVLVTDPADPVVTALNFFLPMACQRPEPSFFPPVSREPGTWGQIFHPRHPADLVHIGDEP